MKRVIITVLSKTEKKIADYLLEHATTARHLSIQELAEDIDVSMSAISRFTKRSAIATIEMRLQLRNHLIIWRSVFCVP